MSTAIIFNYHMERTHHSLPSDICGECSAVAILISQVLPRLADIGPALQITESFSQKAPTAASTGYVNEAEVCALRVCHATKGVSMAFGSSFFVKTTTIKSFRSVLLT